MRGRAFDAVAAQRWAIEPSWLRIIGELAQRNHDAPEVLRARLDRPLNQTARATVRDGVAIVPIIGPIFPYANMMTEMSGATALSQIAVDFQQALDDDEVKAILLEIDSPGGVAQSINEFADQVRAGAAKKPVTAYTSGLAASAAFWIASNAGEIVTDAAGMLGSIGVVTMVSVQEKAGSDGYRDFEITSSNAENKRPDPSTEAGRAEVVRLLDSIETQFHVSVARGRGVSLDTVRSDFGRGGMLVGADAVRAGMADRVGNQEETIARLAAGKGKLRSDGAPRAIITGSGGARAATQEDLMTKKTAAEIAAEHPEAAAALRTEGQAAAEAGHKVALDAAVAAARAETLKTERERVSAIVAASRPGTEKLVAAAIAEGKSAGDYALAVLDASKAAGETVLGNLKAAEAGLAAATVAPVATITGGATAAPADQPAAAAAPIDAEAAVAADEKLWSADAKVRDEFAGDKKAFLAFQAATRKGIVRTAAPRSAA